MVPPPHLTSPPHHHHHLSLLTILVPLSFFSLSLSAFVSVSSYVHVDLDELLRAEAAQRTPAGEELREALAAGEPVDDEVVLRVVRAKMRKAGGSKFLLDGFPRSLSQAFAFEKQVGPVHTVVYLERSLQKLQQAAEEAREKEDNGEGGGKVDVEQFLRDTRAVTDFYTQLGKVAVVPSDSLSKDQSYVAVVCCCCRRCRCLCYTRC